MDLAMKGVNNFESKAKKEGSKTKSKKSKKATATSKSGSTSTKKSRLEPTVMDGKNFLKLPKDATAEDIEEMLRMNAGADASKSGKADKKEHVRDEL